MILALAWYHVVLQNLPLLYMYSVVNLSCVGWVACDCHRCVHCGEFGVWDIVWWEDHVIVDFSDH